MKLLSKPAKFGKFASKMPKTISLMTRGANALHGGKKIRQRVGLAVDMAGLVATAGFMIAESNKPIQNRPPVGDTAPHTPPQSHNPIDEKLKPLLAFGLIGGAAAALLAPNPVNFAGIAVAVISCCLIVYSMQDPPEEEDEIIIKPDTKEEEEVILKAAERLVESCPIREGEVSCFFAACRIDEKDVPNKEDGCPEGLSPVYGHRDLFDTQAFYNVETGVTIGHAQAVVRKYNNSYRTNLTVDELVDYDTYMQGDCIIEAGNQTCFAVRCSDAQANSPLLLCEAVKRSYERLGQSIPGEVTTAITKSKQSPKNYKEANEKCRNHALKILTEKGISKDALIKKMADMEMHTTNFLKNKSTKDLNSMSPNEHANVPINEVKNLAIHHLVRRLGYENGCTSSEKPSWTNGWLGGGAWVVARERYGGYSLCESHQTTGHAYYRAVEMNFSEDAKGRPMRVCKNFENYMGDFRNDGMNKTLDRSSLRCAWTMKRPCPVQKDRYVFRKHKESSASSGNDAYNDCCSPVYENWKQHTPFPSMFDLNSSLLGKSFNLGDNRHLHWPPLVKKPAYGKYTECYIDEEDSEKFFMPDRGGDRDTMINAECMLTPGLKMDKSTWKDCGEWAFKAKCEERDNLYSSYTKCKEKTNKIDIPNANSGVDCRGIKDKALCIRGVGGDSLHKGVPCVWRDGGFYHGNKCEFANSAMVDGPNYKPTHVGDKNWTDSPFNIDFANQMCETDYPHHGTGWAAKYAKFCDQSGKNKDKVYIQCTVDSTPHKKSVYKLMWNQSLERHQFLSSTRGTYTLAFDNRHRVAVRNHRFRRILNDLDWLDDAYGTRCGASPVLKFVDNHTKLALVCGNTIERLTDKLDNVGYLYVNNYGDLRIRDRSGTRDIWVKKNPTKKSEGAFHNLHPNLRLHWGNYGADSSMAIYENNSIFENYSKDFRRLRTIAVDCGSGAGINKFVYRRSDDDKYQYYNFGCLAFERSGSSKWHATTKTFAADGNTVYLDRQEIDCKGHAINFFKLRTHDNHKNVNYDYTCNTRKADGPCRETRTGYEKRDSETKYLDRLGVVCNVNEVLTKVKLVTHNNDEWYYKFTCCRIKGNPNTKVNVEWNKKPRDLRGNTLDIMRTKFNKVNLRSSCPTGGKTPYVKGGYECMGECTTPVTSAADCLLAGKALGVNKLGTDGSPFRSNKLPPGCFSYSVGGKLHVEYNGKLDGIHVSLVKNLISQNKVGPICRRARPTDIMDRGDFLRQGDCMTSACGRYRLCLQGDGNLVLRGSSNKIGDSFVRWSSGTYAFAGEMIFLFVKDFPSWYAGDLIVSRMDNLPYSERPLWRAGERMVGDNQGWLHLQDDGNLVLRRERDNRAMWATRTSTGQIGH